MGTSEQWDYCKLNLGEWRGSFAQLSPTGEIVRESPSLLQLKERNDARQVQLELEVFDALTGTRERHIEFAIAFDNVDPKLAFFETGAFVQGSLQFSPLAEFGAEFGFIAGDRRHRQVQLYKPGAQLPRITTIREYRVGSNASEQPALTIEALLGDWQGEAITHYVGDRPTERYSTQLQVSRDGDRLWQTTRFPTGEMTSSARIQDRTLLFDESANAVQVLLLEDGSSATVPLAIPRVRSFFLEAGWLHAPTQRQRLIRRYGDRGNLESITLVVETKQA
ncbi:DUF3598 family protein [Synechococcus sp. PCC 7336]|uniref:DUF3598 family protein n=1 Tax=Synechococcus sp. PCC 7336 TaxID=195250 RepID=UPI00034AB48E|nr:DUF3598 family protein [Synechococcus sp. PCC 7336]